MYLDDHTPTWSRVGVIARYKNEMDEFLLGIKDKEPDLAYDGQGNTASKNQLREQIGLKGAIVAGILYSFAADTGDKQLEAKVQLNKTDFAQQRDQDLPAFAQRLVTTAGKYVEAAAEYGLSEAMVTELSTTIDDYRPLVGLARLRQSAGHVANAEVSQLLDSVLELLNTKMDRVMLQFQATDPAFYDGYQRARVIVDN